MPQIVGWKWRRVYSGLPGQTVFIIANPNPNEGYFVLLDAADTDGDGLSNGYESWFTYNGNRTVVDHRDFDRDSLQDGWEVAYGLDPTASAIPNGGTGNPDGDAYSNVQEYNNNSSFASSSFDPLKHFVNETPRPVVSIYSSDPIADGLAGTATFAIQRSVGDFSKQLKVYYSVGGDATYSDDYNLSPAPDEYPRIFSATIPAGQATVLVTLSRLAPSLKKVGSRKVVIKLTPYGVSEQTQVADPLAWKYVVNLFSESVTLNIYHDLPGFNGPVYAIKLYKTVVIPTWRTGG